MQDVEQHELLKVYESDFGKDALAILQLMTQPKRWALHTIYPPLKSYVNNRVVLIGDAVRCLPTPEPFSYAQPSLFPGTCDGSIHRGWCWAGFRGRLRSLSLPRSSQSHKEHIVGGS